MAYEKSCERTEHYCDVNTIFKSCWKTSHKQREMVISFYSTGAPRITTSSSRRRVEDTTILILTVKSCHWDKIVVVFFNFCADNRYKHISTDPTTTRSWISIWYSRLLETYSDSSISVINIIFTDIRQTTISTCALLWDIFSVPNTVVSRGTPVACNPLFTCILVMLLVKNKLERMQEGIWMQLLN